MSSKLRPIARLAASSTLRYVATIRPCLSARRQPSISSLYFRFYSAEPLRLESNVFRGIPEMHNFRRDLIRKDRTVGMVPTMGALHEGHLSLIRAAAAENTDVFVSIYVNPTQFGLNEDLASYPKTWEADLQMLEQLDQDFSKTSGSGRITAVFAPTTKSMYPTVPPDSSLPGVGSFVEMRPLGQLLEGASRPVFFRGVATVCMKLFNICRPDSVYFGQKDIQQTRIIKNLISDFHLPTKLRIMPTSREPDGLALSSRNVYLGERRRKVGLVLSQSLRKAEAQYKAGKRKRGDILWPANDHANQVLLVQEDLEKHERALFQVDYISLADPDTMQELDEVDETRGAILSGAVKMLPIEQPQETEDLGVGGGQIAVRLIDNIVLDPVV